MAQGTRRRKGKPRGFQLKLNRADLTRWNLRGADLRDADLSFSNLDSADLSGANLNGATLWAANLRAANLEAAKLRVNLIFATLTLARLANADLTDAVAGGTVFANTNLGAAKGLETMRHNYPSTVGVDTIYKSQGQIPDSFLRGAGVPETLIKYLPSLFVPGAIQFYSCFISYSTKDQEFADRLYADLQNKGVRCWFAPHDVQGGKKLHEQIDEAIRLHERLLLILSPNSMASEWVKTEIRKARRRERVEKKRVLFPVRLASFDAIREWELFDADEGKDLATEIREYYIPDFSGWKDHDPYVKEFEKLLRDLRTEPSE